MSRSPNHGLSLAQRRAKLKVWSKQRLQSTSFDGGRQFSLMDALRTRLRYGAVPEGLQFVILSHDNNLEKYFDRLNGTGDWRHQKLQGMPPKGRLMVSTQQSERLKAQAL